MSSAPLGPSAWPVLPRPLRRLGAWALLVAVLGVTWAPLRFKPRLGGPQIDRFGAWALVGAAFGWAGPRRPWATALAAVLAASASEALQLAADGRHARWSDGAAKAAGAAAGTALAALARRRSRPSGGDGA